ncbi:hypothetical protein [Arundinibacter roseus]|uniref:Outer membrane protein beta-barrel domain-containing protein n=1 Tax=Arundinibacter roseus TaxID=2070510 RepID=A0A4R4KG26_9BACT|nr:hypothetical protein [Arundinibacter roseus]TDB65786.1 hypothetical protein EZE20_08440 [Arundinibacter roseus]
MRLFWLYGLLQCLIFIGCPESYAQSVTAPTGLLRWKLHIDNRTSFIPGGNFGMWGGSLGYTWGTLEREVTLGYYWAGSRGKRQLSAISKAEAKQTDAAGYSKTDLYFVSTGYWHILFNEPRWKAGIPIELGIGQSTTTLVLLSGEPLSEKPVEHTLVPLQIGGYGEWKATRWVGLGLQSGYRHNLRPSQSIPSFNGVFFRVRVLVYPQALRDGLAFVFKEKPLPSPFWGDKKKNK